MRLQTWEGPDEGGGATSFVGALAPTRWEKDGWAGLPRGRAADSYKS